GIRANCLCPGGTATPMMAEIDRRRQGTDHFLAGHPIGRYAEPAEIAAAAAYLLSDDASFVLGAAVMVDGGYSARCPARTGGAATRSLAGRRATATTTRDQIPHARRVHDRTGDADPGARAGAPGTDDAHPAIRGDGREAAGQRA